MTYNYRDSSGQIGSKTQDERDNRQRSFACSDRSGAIPSLQDSCPPVKASTSVKESSATFRNGIIEVA
jgi:hypothetical protein